MNGNDEFRSDEYPSGGYRNDDRTEELRGDEFRDGEVGASAAPAHTLPRPTGPSWGTVALGLICLVVAGGALWVEWADLDLDWTRSGPLTLVGLGIILVLVGLAALLRKSDDVHDGAAERRGQ